MCLLTGMRGSAPKLIFRMKESQQWACTRIEYEFTYVLSDDDIVLSPSL